MVIDHLTTQELKYMSASRLWVPYLGNTEEPAAPKESKMLSFFSPVALGLAVAIGGLGGLNVCMRESCGRSVAASSLLQSSRSLVGQQHYALSSSKEGGGDCATVPSLL